MNDGLPIIAKVSRKCQDYSGIHFPFTMHTYSNTCIGIFCFFIFVAFPAPFAI